MPKDYFNVSRATALESVAAGAKIHVSGVCGVAMAQLAVELVRRGFAVSGSDKEFYEPMGSFLKRSSVALKEGYKAEHIPEDASLVVIGNALVYENPEVQEVERRKIPYSLFPKILYDVVIRGKQSIVVSGTHGKSTTTALMAWLLSRMQLSPSYFIGAAVPDLPSSLVSSTGELSVVEGDEYDSAFFAKVPKFTFYKPNTLIVTAIEYDHADIYSSLKQIEDEFTKLVTSLPDDADVICCIDTENVTRLVEEWRETASCKITTYGKSGGADIQLVDRHVEGRTQHVTLALHDGAEVGFSLSLPGEHNALNATAAYIACMVNNLDIETAGNLMRGFLGAKRRQEVRFDSKNVTLIDDFAHHPTAVRETLSALRSFYPGRRLWAVFEPRSNTSRRKVFQKDYVSAFRSADRVVLCDVAARSIDAGQELIKVSDLAESIGLAGTPAVALHDADAIRSYLMEHMEPGDVFVIMSNGSFGGLVGKFEGELRAKIPS